MNQVGYFKYGLALGDVIAILDFWVSVVMISPLVKAPGFGQSGL